MPTFFLFAYDCTQLLSTFVSLRNFSCLEIHSSLALAIMTIIASCPWNYRQTIFPNVWVQIPDCFPPVYWYIIDKNILVQCVQHDDLIYLCIVDFTLLNLMACHQIWFVESWDLSKNSVEHPGCAPSREKPPGKDTIIEQLYLEKVPTDLLKCSTRNFRLKRMSCFHSVWE